ncbi:MAG: hypothetical protein ACREX3_19730 [Gammaproteobacteria bacterium]
MIEQRIEELGLPGKLTCHSGQHYIQIVLDHSQQALLLAALRLVHNQPPPIAALRSATGEAKEVDPTGTMSSSR